MPQVRVRMLVVLAAAAVAVMAVPLPAAGVLSGQPPVMQTGHVFTAVGADDDFFGQSVAIDGNTAVVGAPGYRGEGAVFVYEYNGYGWAFSQELPADPAVGDRFGHSVDVSGDFIVVGAPEDSVSAVNRGTAHVYQRTPGGWAYLSELVPSSASAGDKFGTSVSVYGTTAVVGAPMDDDWNTDAGAIYIFKQGVPMPVKYLSGATEVNSEFGYAVDLYGNYLAVAAPFDDNVGGVDAGIVHMYYGDGVTPWTFNRALYASSPHANDNFGYSVATNGADTFVGNWGYDANGQTSAGMVDVFTRSGSGTTAVWPGVQPLMAPQPDDYSYFGKSVSVNGSVAVIGAFWEGVTHQGAAYFYEKTGGGWVLTRGVPGAGWFGTSVAASHDGRFVVGAMTGAGMTPDCGDAYFYAVWDPVYRFYNARAGTHFYTDSATERDHVMATWPDIFSYEGVAYSVNPYGNKAPLYRFYKPSSSSHFYTADEAERDHVIATWPTIYQYDGPTYEVSPSFEAAKVTVYRFYNLRNGSHFYTASVAERDNVIATLGATYQYEGPAFWLGQ